MDLLLRMNEARVNKMACRVTLIYQMHDKEVKWAENKKNISLS